MSRSHLARARSERRRFLAACVLVPLAAFLLATLLAAVLLPGHRAPAEGGTAQAQATGYHRRLATSVPGAAPPATPSTRAALPRSPTRRATDIPRSNASPTTDPGATAGGCASDASDQPAAGPTGSGEMPPVAPSDTPAPFPAPAPDASYFGVAMQQIDAAHGLAQAALAGVGITRVSELRWDVVEPVRTDPPSYRWGEMSGVEQELLNASQSGIGVMILVMYTPSWARQVPSHACSSIRADALGAYAEFLSAAVQRYSQAPFGVHDWEFYNEPDVDPSLVPASSGMGCWGDGTDPFYGGRAYGRMLMAAYPAVKGADPAARVIVGGLLLDRPDTPPSTFLAGLLEAGAAGSFDLLAYHAYAFYLSPTVPESDLALDMPWNSWGGVVAGKARFLREVLAHYGAEKPLVLNEAGLGWIGSQPPPVEFAGAQADYVTKLYARGRALGLVNVIWYGWEAPGWRHMALLNPDLSPRPGMLALELAVEQLGEAQYTGAVTSEGIEGYAFLRPNDRLQVLWPGDPQAPATIRVPLQAFLEALNSVGEAIPHAEESGQAVLIVERPLYLVTAP